MHIYGTRGRWRVLGTLFSSILRSREYRQNIKALESGHGTQALYIHTILRWPSEYRASRREPLEDVFENARVLSFLGAQNKQRVRAIDGIITTWDSCSRLLYSFCRTSFSVSWTFLIFFERHWRIAKINLFFLPNSQPYFFFGNWSIRENWTPELPRRIIANSGQLEIPL